MSWLAQGLTSSVTGKISQIGGQLKEILTESTEDTVDPNTEMKVMNDRMKELEKRLETMSMESQRWQDESNELNLKCQTYEAQLEQRQADFRQQLMLKESQIVELKNQLNSNASKLENLSPGYHQKSSLMEEFEEIMPSSELNDYIQLQKEIKRLREDNVHLSSENKELLKRVKILETTSSATDNTMYLQGQETQIESLKHEINSLKVRLEQDKDKHQGEIVAIQQQYKDKTNQQTSEYENEIADLREKVKQLELDLERTRGGSGDEAATSKMMSSSTTTAVTGLSSNKSDDGWCLNGEEVKLSDLDDKSGCDHEILIAEKDKEIEQLKSQVETFESDLEQANNLIMKLKSSSRASSESPKKQQQQADEEVAARLKQAESHVTELTAQLDSLRAANADLKRRLECDRDEYKRAHDLLTQERDGLVDQVDSLKLELKQHQQSVQQERMLQMQEAKHDKIELDKLKKENAELNSKLDEKLSEINVLGDQINDLNANVNSLKSTDAALFGELQSKTERFLAELDKANTEIAALRVERDELIAQRSQFEFVLDEKTRESAQLRADVARHVEHIGAQARALDKLQEDLRDASSQHEREQQQRNEKEKERTMSQSSASSEQVSTSEEMNALKAQYNELYVYVEKKNQESLNYYNEIQRLNGVLQDQNTELYNLKSLNENLSDQYENLSREFQFEQKLVEDLNHQIDELKKSLESTFSNIRHQTPERSNSTAELATTTTTKTSPSQTVVDESQSKAAQVEQLENRVDELTKEKIALEQELKSRIEQLEGEIRIKEENTVENQYKLVVEQLEARIDELTQEKSELQNLSGEEHKQVEVDKSLIQQLQTRIDELLNEERIDKTVVVQLENRIEELVKEKVELEERLQNVEHQHKSVVEDLQSRINEQVQSSDENSKSLVEQATREKTAELESIKSELEAKFGQLVEQMQARIGQLESEKSGVEAESRRVIDTMTARVEQCQAYYEALVKQENEKFREILSNEEQQKAKMGKELARLKEHLMEMSENYTKEAVQAEEREKQLRNALNEAQSILQQQGANLESSSKEMELRMDQLVLQNQELTSAKEKLKDKLKQSEENLNHQVKVTKNLELVLERLQNEKDGQHSLELSKFQQIIKEQAVTIHNLQNEAQNHNKKLEELKASIEAIGRLEQQLIRKDEQIKILHDQIATKDALIESIEKRVNEIQKVNDSYIEKEMVKNLIIGYIKVHQPQEKKQVLRLISTMLNFTPAENEQVESSDQSGKWFSSLLNKSPSTPNKSAGGGAGSGGGGGSSFADLLIQYVDRESKPKANLKFDLNDSTLATSKKTDSSLLLSQSMLDMSNTESAVKFFNNSLVGNELVNRTQPQQQQQQQQPNIQNVANSILEQILK